MVSDYHGPFMSASAAAAAAAAADAGVEDVGSRVDVSVLESEIDELASQVRNYDLALRVPKPPWLFSPTESQAWRGVGSDDSVPNTVLISGPHFEPGFAAVGLRSLATVPTGAFWYEVNFTGNQKVPYPFKMYDDREQYFVDNQIVKWVNDGFSIRGLVYKDLFYPTIESVVSTFPALYTPTINPSVAERLATMRAARNDAKIRIQELKSAILAQGYFINIVLTSATHEVSTQDAVGIPYDLFKTRDRSTVADLLELLLSVTSRQAISANVLMSTYTKVSTGWSIGRLMSMILPTGNHTILVVISPTPPPMDGGGSGTKRPQIGSEV